MPLFTRHPLALQTAYSDLKRRAQEQRELLVGTPGSVGVREVGGRSFYYRQYYDAIGKKGAEYLGSVGSSAGESRAEAARQAIGVSQELVKDGRMLAQAGYVRVDARTGAILGAMANRGLFRGGAVLVGSHAYGALLNEVGVRAAARGKERVHVEVLTLRSGENPDTSRSPEVRMSAGALPEQRPLLDAPIDGIVMGRAGVVPVKVPRAEALAWHKVMLASMRGASSDKRKKDLAQAAVLLAALAEDAADAVRSGFEELPRRMRGATRRGAESVLATLRDAGYERAEEVVRDAMRS